MKYSHLTHYTILILLCQRGGFFIAYGQESEGEINAIIDYIDLSSHDPQGTAVL